MCQERATGMPQGSGPRQQQWYVFRATLTPKTKPYPDTEVPALRPSSYSVIIMDSADVISFSWIGLHKIIQQNGKTVSISESKNIWRINVTVQS